MKFVIGLFLLVAVSQANATTLRSRVQSLAGTKFFDLQSTIAELKELDKSEAKLFADRGEASDIAKQWLVGTESLPLRSKFQCQGFHPQHPHNLF